MKKINYFNKELKPDIDITKGIIEITEESYEIKHLSIQVEDSDLDYHLNIINTCYGEFGEVTIEDDDISIVKQKKINEISSICEDKIINEFFSSCLGESKKFDCTLTDQSNIMGLVAKAQMILASLTADTTLDWKASGEPICYTWTPIQAITLGADLFTHKTTLIKRFEAIRVYIYEQTDVELIKGITWDTVISKGEGVISES